MTSAAGLRRARHVRSSLMNGLAGTQFTSRGRCCTTKVPQHHLLADERSLKTKAIVPYPWNTWKSSNHNLTRQRNHEMGTSLECTDNSMRLVLFSFLTYKCIYFMWNTLKYFLCFASKHISCWDFVSTMERPSHSLWKSAPLKSHCLHLILWMGTVCISFWDHSSLLLSFSGWKKMSCYALSWKTIN